MDIAVLLLKCVRDLLVLKEYFCFTYVAEAPVVGLKQGRERLVEDIHLIEGDRGRLGLQILLLVLVKQILLESQPIRPQFWNNQEVTNGRYHRHFYLSHELRECNRASSFNLGDPLHFREQAGLHLLIEAVIELSQLV